MVMSVYTLIKVDKETHLATYKYHVIHFVTDHL